MPAARILLWVATIGAFAVLLKSLVVGPPSLLAASIVMVAYTTLCVLGFLVPRWQMYADCRQQGEPGKARVALTFDDGPDPTSTPRVLELLARYAQRATFFVIGKKAEQHPDLIQAIVRAGHEIGLHGFCHSRVTAFKSPRWIADDLEKAQNALRSLGVRPSRWLRPPIGHVTARLGAVAEQLGLELVCWSVRALDGLTGANPDRVATRVKRRLHDGAIVMMHDAAERGGRVPAGVGALESVLLSLQDRGWRSVTLTELFGPEPEAAGSEPEDREPPDGPG